MGRFPHTHISSADTKDLFCPPDHSFFEIFYVLKQECLVHVKESKEMGSKSKEERRITEITRHRYHRAS